MPVLIEKDSNFNKEELDFLYECGSTEFPWYHGMATKNFPCLTHNFMRRTDLNVTGIPCSPYFPFAEKMFLRLCADNGIIVRKIYRMALNLTFSDPSKHGDPHIDHQEFSHKHMLIYLNKFDAGETFLFDETGTNIVKTIKPKMDKFVVFDGGWHAQGFCRPQQSRVVFVATFDGDIE
jgi:hypothetical protein